MLKNQKKSLIVCSILSAFLAYLPVVNAQVEEVGSAIYSSFILVFGILQAIVSALLDSLEGNAVLSKGLIAILMGIIFYSELKEVKVFKNKSAATGIISFLVSISIAYWLPEKLTENIFSATNPFIGFIFCCLILLIARGDSNWSVFGRIIAYLGLAISFTGLLGSISGTVPVTIVSGFVVASVVAFFYNIFKLKGGTGGAGGRLFGPGSWKFWTKERHPWEATKDIFKGSDRDKGNVPAGAGGGPDITNIPVIPALNNEQEALGRSKQANETGQELVGDEIKNTERIRVELEGLPAAINRMQEQYTKGEPVDKIEVILKPAQTWQGQNKRFNDNYSKISNYLTQIHSYLFKNGQEIDNLLNAVKTLSPENQKKINDLKGVRRNEHSKLIELGNTQKKDYERILDYSNIFTKLLIQTRENINKDKYDDARKNAVEAIKINRSIEQLLAEIGMVLQSLKKIDEAIINSDTEIREIIGIANKKGI